ncbi:hypothetical protein MRX96_029612 [Rhipicephalus microplus]
MFHGGTSFGFKAATSSESPLVTSYDYDAPMGEDGDPKAYYFTLRKSIGKYIPLKSGELRKPWPKLKIDAIRMPHSMSLTDVMAHFRDKGWLKRRRSEYPLTFEELGQDFGFLLVPHFVHGRPGWPVLNGASRSPRHGAAARA